MSTNFKSLMGKFTSSSPRERILLLALVGTIAVAGTYWLTVTDDTSNAAGNPPVNIAKPQPAKPKNTLTAAPAGEQAMRNPFLPPAEFQVFDDKKDPLDKTDNPISTTGKQVTATPPKAKDYSNLDALLKGTGKSTDTKASVGRPGLVGIVEGAGKRVAIIQYGGESRSYGIYERIGPYQVTSISSSSVILSGPAGRTVLAVGR